MNMTLILKIQQNQMSKYDSTAAQQLASLSELFARFNRSGERGPYRTAVPRLSLLESTAGELNTPKTQSFFSQSTNQVLQVSLPQPSSEQMRNAISDERQLFLILDLDREALNRLLLEVKEKICSGAPLEPALAARQLLDAVVRFLKILELPADIPFLAPMLEREILYWLLKTNQGDKLLSIVQIEERLQPIERAVRFITKNFHQPIRAKDIARIACMSQTALYRHFRIVTNMTPLQYQKKLRLQEARRLMLIGTENSSTAGFNVGYSSPSHFCREYTRMFGDSPTKDIARLRECAVKPY